MPVPKPNADYRFSGIVLKNKETAVTTGKITAQYLYFRLRSNKKPLNLLFKHTNLKEITHEQS